MIDFTLYLSISSKCTINYHDSFIIGHKLFRFELSVHSRMQDPQIWTQDRIELTSLVPNSLFFPCKESVLIVKVFSIQDPYCSEVTSFDTSFASSQIWTCKNKIDLSCDFLLKVKIWVKRSFILHSRYFFVCASLNVA